MVRQAVAGSTVSKDALLRTLYVLDDLHVGVALPVGPRWRRSPPVRYRLRFRRTIQVYLLLPFTIPLGCVSGLGMMTFFGEIRVLGSYVGRVGLALCVINLPLS